MPARGKRVASRQAQLNRRRRRQARNAADLESQHDGEVRDSHSTATIAAPVQESESLAASTAEGAADTLQPDRERPRSAAGQDTARVQVQNRLDQALPYRHLATEMRRILILAGILTVVLLTVSFLI